MPNIIDALSKLENDLKKSLSLNEKSNVLTSFKDQEILGFLVKYRYYGNNFKDTTIKRKKALSGDKKEWYNYPLPTEKIKGTFKRFCYLRRILEKDELSVTDKFEKLKAHCYREEWALYKKIINKQFFKETLYGNETIDLIPAVLLKKLFNIGNVYSLGFMRCDEGKPVFPCFIEPKIPGVRVKVIISHNLTMKAFTVYNGSVLEITSYFQKFNITEPLELDGIIRPVRFGTDSQENLVNGLIPDFYVFDCYNEEKIYLSDRKKLLLKIASMEPSITLIPYITVYDMKQAIQFKNNCISKGYRGAILKQSTSFYWKHPSNKWIDISNKELTTCKIIAVIGDRNCNSLVVMRNGVESVASIKETHQSLLWKQRHTILGKYCCVDEEGCFVKFNPNKS